ncbi:MAG TPA: hypothetical protein VEC12_08280, partial [Bacteroidia bacterium]|nr:hypothetical protein [Bacteroidia bacterium]
MNKSIRIVILLTIYFSLATTLNAQLNYGTFSSPSLTTPLRVGLNTPTSVPDAQLHLYSEYRVACEGCVGPYDVPNFLITREYNTLIPPPSSPSALKPFMEVRYTDNTWSPSIVKTHFLLNGLGNLGLGTGTPIARLHVEGTSYLNGNVGIGTFNNGVASVEIDRSSNTLWGAFILNHAGNGRVLRLKGGFANGTQPIFQVEANTWGTNDLVEDNIRFRVLGNGDVQVNNLAGTGTRMVVADASGYLSTLPTPGNQQLFVNGNTLGITNGNTVIIPGDNLGNHTASTDLNMSSYSLYGIKGLSFANGGAELTMFNNTLE